MPLSPKYAWVVVKKDNSIVDAPSINDAIPLFLDQIKAQEFADEINKIYGKDAYEVVMLTIDEHGIISRVFVTQNGNAYSAFTFSSSTASNSVTIDNDNCSSHNITGPWTGPWRTI